MTGLIPVADLQSADAVWENVRRIRAKFTRAEVAFKREEERKRAENDRVAALVAILRENARQEAARRKREADERAAAALAAKSTDVIPLEFAAMIFSRHELSLSRKGETYIAKFREVFSAIEAVTLISQTALVSRRRTAEVVAARQLAYWAAATFTTMSYPEIGRRLGRRDHATVLYGARRIDSLLGSRAGELEKLPYLTAIVEAWGIIWRP